MASSGWKGATPTIGAVFFFLLLMMGIYIAVLFDYAGIQYSQPKSIHLSRSGANSLIRRIGSGKLAQTKRAPTAGGGTTNSTSSGVVNSNVTSTQDKNSTGPGEPSEKESIPKGQNETQENQDKKEPSPQEDCTFDIQPENAKVTPRKEEISLYKVNQELLGRSFHQATEAASMANKTLPDIIAKRKAMSDKARMIDQTITEMDLAVDLDDYRVLPGGHWIPTSCKPRWKVAIVVPFRNRFKHLPIFLRHIVPLLKRQKLEFSIFIAEQRNNIKFNRAMLMNVGFVEALNFTNYDCTVFHDVDHIALNAKNYFGCDDMPRHFISGEVMWNYKLAYADLFGGVTGLTTSQLYAINGLPNAYWGWGGEDDDFYRRVINKKFKRTRPELEIGYFDTIDHKGETKRNEARFCLLNKYQDRMTTDGLSNLAYDQPVIELHPLYTNVSVNIQELPWNPRWSRCPGGRR